MDFDLKKTILTLVRLGIGHNSKALPSFYNNFKVQKGVYLTVQAYSLAEGRLLLACPWGEFWNRLKRMRNREEVLTKLKKACPLVANIFTNISAPHFAFVDKEQKQGAVV